MKKSYLVILCSALALFSCKKESEENAPSAAVDIYISSSSAAFSNLNAVGGWIYVNGGTRGILVYRISTDDFKAYERNCTYQSSDACATVIVDASNVIAKDTCCHSEFAMYDGAVIQGPASIPLRAYRTTWDGATLHIYN